MNAEINPKLQEIKNMIEKDILQDERIKDNAEFYQVTLDILENASYLLNKAENKNDLLFIYNTLSIRLYESGMICKKMRNPVLGNILIHISKTIENVLDSYLLFSISIKNKSALISRLWPHNCQNLEDLKKVLREYIVENAVLLLCYNRLVIDFLKNFEVEIGEADNINQLNETYERIQYEAEKTAEKHFAVGNHEYAWQYGVIGLVIKYMLSDFEHCLSRYMYSGKQTHLRTGTLRFRRHNSMPHQDNKILTKKTTQTYATMEMIVQKLREELDSKISQRIEEEFKDNEVVRAYEILVTAEDNLSKARTERELIAIYDMIVERLKGVTYQYKSRVRLAYVLYRLAEIIHESIKEYLPHRVHEIDLVKLLWPHNCYNLKQMKKVFHEYVLYNTSLLGSSERLANNLLRPYMKQIKNVENLLQLREIYEDIQVDFLELERESYEKREYKEAWEVGVIANVVGYLLSDFGYCLSYPSHIVFSDNL